MAVGEIGKLIYGIEHRLSGVKTSFKKTQRVAKLRVVREAEEAKKVEKAASAAEKFRSELDVLKQRALEIPRTLTDDEIRACEALKLQIKGSFLNLRR